MIKNIAILLVCFAHTAMASDKPVDVIAEHTLSNGLQIYVKPDNRAPAAVFQLWYHVGGGNEFTGKNGLSHMLEHMMFKGTKAHPETQFSSIISSYGGEYNAMTSSDFTVYYETLATSALPIAFELEADRMANLQLNNDAFQKEREVVKEERRMRREDVPGAMLYERTNAIAYTSNPYRSPLIGWMSDINNYVIEDLQEWYNRWYAPNNATLVVVGKVKPEEVFAMAEKYFGHIPSKTLPKTLQHTQDEQPLGERRVIVERIEPMPSLLIAYNTPVLKTATDPKKIYALWILSYVLDGGDSTRLSKYLIRDQRIATGTSVGYNPWQRLDELFVISATPTQGKTLDVLENAVLEQVTLLQTTPISDDELNRVKTIIRSQWIYDQDSLSAQGERIGQLRSVGLPVETLDQTLTALQAVTKEQVQAAAKEFLTKERRTVGWLQPLAPPAGTVLPMTNESAVNSGSIQ